MNQIRGIAFALALAVSGAAWAGADDEYIEAYRNIQDGDAAQDGGHVADARRVFLEAQERLLKIKKIFPEWNERVVAYRLRYVAEKLASLPAPPVSGNSPAPARPGEPAAGLAAPGEVIEQFNALNARIGALTQERNGLEARLREALAAQPAPIDPREFQRAVETIAALQTTNRLLVARLDQEQSERRRLVDKVVAEEAQAALNDANRKLAAERAAVLKLDREKVELEGALDQLSKARLKPLEQENVSLKAQVDQLKSDTERGRQIAELTAKLAQGKARLEESERQREHWSDEAARLRRQLDDSQARQSEDAVLRTKRLESDLLIARAEANRQSARADEIVGQLASEKSARMDAERERQNLAVRVTALSGELASARGAQSALAAERTARMDAENQLRLTEQRLVVANTALSRLQGGGRAGDSDAAREALRAQSQALTEETQQIRAALAESRKHEGELAALLEESSARQREWRREKAALLARLHEAGAGMKENDPGGRTHTEAAWRILEARVHELETQRHDVSGQLTDASVDSNRRVATFHGLQPLTPPERAVQFRSGH